MGPLLGVSTMKQLDFLLMTIPWCYKISTETYLISISLVDQASARTDIKVQLGAWSWDTVSGEEFRVGAGLAEPYPITWPRACCHPWP
ncbi:unnamed protein product [Camellia sinensis]